MPGEQDGFDACSNTKARDINIVLDAGERKAANTYNGSLHRQKKAQLEKSVRHDEALRDMRQIPDYQ